MMFDAFVLISVLIFISYILNRRIGIAAKIFVGYFSLQLIIGRFGMTVFSYADDLIFDLSVNVTTQQHNAAALSILTAILFFILGYQKYNLYAPKSSSLRVAPSESIGKSGFPGPPEQHANAINLILNGLLSSAVVVYFLSYPDYGLFSREEYLPQTIDRTMKGVSGLLILISYSCLALLGRSTSLNILWFFVISVLFISAASRSVLFPVVGILLAALIRGERYMVPKTMFWSGVVLLELMAVIYFRGLDSHGFLEYFKNEHLVQVFDVGFVGFIFNYIFSVSYAVTANLAGMDYTYSNFLISIDPRLGFMVGWPNISDSLRINPYAPFNTMSELAAVGWLYLACYYAAAGRVFGYCSRRLSGHRVLSIVVIILAFLFTIISAQYNLRSATRILYYTIFITLFLSFMGSLTYRRRRVNMPS